ncbi:MAG: hypothetical protein DWQ04_05470 [Chloroflexi bacterium]|nr:MAG: hypothetical protein DWQ04_05470 [Chloroflexota bacterium]
MKLLFSQSRAAPTWVLFAFLALIAGLASSQWGRVNAASSGDTIYVSAVYEYSVDGIAYTRDDILAYDVGSDSWSMYFDGSDVGIPTKANITGFTKLSDGSLLLTFLSDGITLPDVGYVDGSDIVRFVPTSLGDTTSGSFEMYFDGSDIGLDDTSQGILDAFTVMPNGHLLISLLGGTQITPSFVAYDIDLVEFTPTSLGETTAGTWSMYFDGSDVGLSDGGDDEDIRGVWIDPTTSELYLSTKGSFSVPGLAGDKSQHWQRYKLYIQRILGRFSRWHDNSSQCDSH